MAAKNREKRKNLEIFIDLYHMGCYIVEDCRKDLGEVEWRENKGEVER